VSPISSRQDAIAAGQLGQSLGQRPEELLVVRQQRHRAEAGERDRGVEPLVAEPTITRIEARLERDARRLPVPGEQLPAQRVRVLRRDETDDREHRPGRHQRARLALHLLRSDVRIL
jgi:hypothetical protein